MLMHVFWETEDALQWWRMTSWLKFAAAAAANGRRQSLTRKKKSSVRLGRQYKDRDPGG